MRGAANGFCRFALHWRRRCGADVHHLTLLLLRVEGGLIKAAAFAAGAMTVRLLQMILFGYVFATTNNLAVRPGPISSPRRCCSWLVSSCYHRRDRMARGRRSRRTAAKVDDAVSRVSALRRLV